ncbi:TTL domain-containing protein [Magnaporthiopsis poae ATCC 64411]|uniref:TTL domain-containing protein n=1 Tax=Magnaporthiopsis poae (strain ATCC 64411 / 73-15) TaxID=644358 RepID=A0A0C4DZV6_MAGP6|nr:TTL domain-containing protein [Magnaporthiopsis poae ATCC 64411]
MHILLVNDDGPPSTHSSPYVHTLVRALQAAGHLVSVCLPHTQRSWIGKAHLVGHTVRPTYYRPPPLPANPAGLIFGEGVPESDGSVDLYSVNIPLVEGVEKSRTLFTGMLQNYWAGGGCFTAVEAAADEDEEEERIREGADGETQGGGGSSATTKPAVDDAAGNEDGVEYVGRVHKDFKWHPRFTDVFKSVDDAPPGNDGWAVREGHTSVTPLKANFWHAATHLHEKELELPPPEQDSRIVTPPLREEAKPSAQVPDPSKPEDKTAPDVVMKTDTAESSSNGKVSQDNAGKFYALVAYEDPYVQPLIMEALDTVLPKDSYVLINAPPRSSDGKGEEAIQLERLLPSPDTKVLQITPYEAIDFTFGAAHVDSMLFNSYVFRKALIRKHFLSATVEAWVTKHPDSVLAGHFKPGTAFEVDYAEFLDDALVEAWDLRASLERNETAAAVDDDCEKKEWWILKPSMSDRGQGIRLFSTMEELQGIFDEWDADLPDSDDEDDEAGAGEASGGGATSSSSSADAGITTAHLRHFVAQPYIHPPLLLPQYDHRKFHVRTYVVCVGSLRVYVYRRMLALFAGKPYSPPSAGAADLDAHLTNTCLQQRDHQDADADADTDAKGGGAANIEPLVREFWDLPDALGVVGSEGGAAAAAITKDSIFAQICDVTGAAFEAAARGMMMHFQPLPNAFEVFGLDFLVDARGAVWLLEVNSFPDFRQTGDDLRGVVAGLWEGVVRLAVVPFFFSSFSRPSPSSASASASASVAGGGKQSTGGEEEEQQGAAGGGSGGGDMVLVKDIDLGRRWGV